jgi:hypothetical protein
MGDGADWIWNISEEQFPCAIQIVDLYHARQHLWALGGQLHPSHEKSKRKWCWPTSISPTKQDRKAGGQTALDLPGSPELVAVRTGSQVL